MHSQHRHKAKRPCAPWPSGCGSDRWAVQSTELLPQTITIDWPTLPAYNIVMGQRCNRFSSHADAAFRFADHLQRMATGATVHKANAHAHILKSAWTLCMQCEGDEDKRGNCPVVKALDNAMAWALANSKNWSR
jgi:hypothetical protein